MKLRTILITTAGGMALLATMAAAALVLLTGSLHRSVADLGASIESVAAAERLEIALLLHARSRDDAVRSVLEKELRAGLSTAESHIGSAAEAALVADIGAELGKYLEVTSRTPDDSFAGWNRIFGSCRELVRLNVEQSHGVRTAAARADALANALGIGTIGVLAFGTVVLVFWLRGRVFRPVVRLRAALAQFAGGDRGARAAEEGPDELREIARRVNELGRALEERDRRQLAFLGGVVHDLRNPLTALKLSLARLDPKLGPAEPDRVARVLTVMNTQIVTVDRMLGDLLDAAQLESGEISLRIEECDVAEVVSESVQLYANVSAAHQVTMVRAGASWNVRCDRTRLAQVVNNLVSNAIKYSPAGGPVTVAARDLGGEVEIEVADAGLGIPDDELPHLFEPFRRGGSAKRLAEGVGLGLHAVRRIVEAHGGTVRVETQPGRGSRFRVRVPRFRPATPPPVAARARSASAVQESGGMN